MKKTTTTPSYLVSDCLKPAEAARRAKLKHSSLDYLVRASREIPAAWTACGSYLVPLAELDRWMKKRKRK